MLFPKKALVNIVGKRENVEHQYSEQFLQCFDIQSEANSNISATIKRETLSNIVRSTTFSRAFIFVNRHGSFTPSGLTLDSSTKTLFRRQF